MRAWVIGAIFCLAACGAQEDAPQGEPAQKIVADVRQDTKDELPVMGPERVILAFGDSLFAGYDLEEDEGYPEVLEAVLRTRGINARVIDAGVSGDTSAAGLQRIAFVLDNQTAEIDLAIVELGGNDLLRGIAPDETRANLDQIMRQLQSRDLPIMLMGMRAPPNGGPEFQAEFDGLYPELAAKYNAALVPFFMEPLLERPELLLGDRIHPTAEGVREMVAANVDAIIAAIPDQ